MARVAGQLVGGELAVRHPRQSAILPRVEAARQVVHVLVAELAQRARRQQRARARSALQDDRRLVVGDLLLDAQFQEAARDSRSPAGYGPGAIRRSRGRRAAPCQAFPASGAPRRYRSDLICARASSRIFFDVLAITLDRARLRNLVLRLHYLSSITARAENNHHFRPCRSLRGLSRRAFDAIRASSERNRARAAHGHAV